MVFIVWLEAKTGLAETFDAPSLPAYHGLNLMPGLALFPPRCVWKKTGRQEGRKNRAGKT